MMMLNVLLLSVSVGHAMIMTPPSHRVTISRCALKNEPCMNEPDDSAEEPQQKLTVPKDLEAIGRVIRGEGKKKPSFFDLVFSPAAGQTEPGPREFSPGSLFARRKAEGEREEELKALLQRGEQKAIEDQERTE